MTETIPNTSLTRGTSRAAEAAREVPLGSQRRWTLSHSFAVVGGLLLIVQASVWARWLASGPSQVTRYRDHGSLNWWAARVFEGVAVVIFVGVVIYLVRQCRRQRRITFDAKFCIACLLTFWLDVLFNYLQPVFFFSTNLVNVTAWLPHMPFVQNPTAEQMVEAPLLIAPLYATGFLLLAMLVNSIMRLAKRRWPQISNARLVVVAVAAGVLADIILEAPVVLLHLWSYPGGPGPLAVFSGASRFPVNQYLNFGPLLFAPLAMLRYFTNDRGEHLFERNLGAYSARARTAISQLAMIGGINLLLILTAAVYAFGALYSDPYPKLPKYILNGFCDSPASGVDGTAYGPCPGTPGYRMPLRSTQKGADTVRP